MHPAIEPYIDLRLATQLLPYTIRQNNSKGDKEWRCPLKEQHVGYNAHHDSKDKGTPHSPHYMPPRILLIHLLVPIANIMTDVVVINQRKYNYERPPRPIPDCKTRDNNSNSNCSQPWRAKKTLYTLKKLLHPSTKDYPLCVHPAY